MGFWDPISIRRESERMVYSSAGKRSTDAGIHILAGFRGLTPEEELKGFIRDFHIGGIVLFRRNIESPEQLKSLISGAQEYAMETLGRPLWVAIDQEGGPVQRLTAPFTKLPSAQELAREGAQAVMEWTEKAAAEMRDLGITINLAPVLDLVSEGKTHFMEARSLGSNPLRVAQLGELWIRALQEGGVSATAKHFPGLGRAESDPHHFAPVIRWPDKKAMELDLIPFRAAANAGVHCVMTSHALYPFLDSEWPATLSPAVNRELLREQLGFEGVLLSDDMDMAAISERYGWEAMVRQGLLATIDFFLLCQRSENIEPFYRALSDAIKKEPELAEARASSLRRIERLFQQHHKGFSLDL